MGKSAIEVGGLSNSSEKNRQISQIDSFFVRDPGVKIKKNSWKPAPSYSLRFL